mgnify:FL=1
MRADTVRLVVHGGVVKRLDQAVEPTTCNDILATS